MFTDKYRLGLTNLVISNKKTQTRIIVKIDDEKFNDFKKNCHRSYDTLNGCPELVEAYYFENRKKYPYKIGDIAAVAQSYHDAGYDCRYYVDTDEYMFIKLNDGYHSIYPKAKFNKMFAESELMPHQVRITNVRIERMQDITEEDALKEGIEKIVGEDKIPRYIMKDKNGITMFSSDKYKSTFEFLMDRIFGKNSYANNPYVFVYDFKLIK